jgi:hypothetical protein
MSGASRIAFTSTNGPSEVSRWVPHVIPVLPALSGRSKQRPYNKKHAFTMRGLAGEIKGFVCCTYKGFQA